MDSESEWPRNLAIKTKFSFLKREGNKKEAVWAAKESHRVSIFIQN